MSPRPRPLAAVRAAATRFPPRGRLLFLALALSAAAGLVAIAWRVQWDGVEPIDIDVAAVSEALSPAPESAPVDASDAAVPDGSADRPDSGEGGAVVGEGDAVVGEGGAVVGEGDAVVGEGDAVVGEGDAVVGEGDAVVGEGDAVEAESGAEDNPPTVDAGGGTVDASEPEAPDGGPTAPLTGELTTDSSLIQRRALAAKVGNGDRRARPQTGLAAADIVYEILIEGGKTRFLAVFHSEIPSAVGPVRSVRSGDIDLLADLSTPYLVSSGANTTVLAEMRQAARTGTFVDVGGLRTFVPYSRDRSRRSPFNLYFHYENLIGEDAAALPGGPLAAPVAPLFDYGSPNPAGIDDAIGVTVTFHRSSGNVVSHIWDAAVGGWVRIQGGALMTTETDFGVTEVAPVNVAVVWMPYRVSAAHTQSPQALSYGTGDALVLTAGTVHHAVWERTEDRAGFRFSDVAGNPLSLSPGSTWLLVANSSRRFPVAEAAVLTASDGARLLADARAAAYAAGNDSSAS